MHVERIEETRRSPTVRLRYQEDELGCGGPELFHSFEPCASM